MKYIKLFAIAVLFFATQTVSAQANANKWPAMKTFHEVLNRVYKPVQTDGNLASVKAYSETLDREARALSASDVPASIKTKELMAAVKVLQENTHTVNKLVKTNGSDEDIKKAINEVNATHNKIMAMYAN